MYIDFIMNPIDTPGVRLRTCLEKNIIEVSIIVDAVSIEKVTDQVCIAQRLVSALSDSISSISWNQWRLDPIKAELIDIVNSLKYAVDFSESVYTTNEKVNETARGVYDGVFKTDLPHSAAEFIPCGANPTPGTAGITLPTHRTRRGPTHTMQHAPARVDNRVTANGLAEMLLKMAPGSSLKPQSDDVDLHVYYEVIKIVSEVPADMPLVDMSMKHRSTLIAYLDGITKSKLNKPQLETLGFWLVGAISEITSKKAGK